MVYERHPVNFDRSLSNLNIHSSAYSKGHYFPKDSRPHHSNVLQNSANRRASYMRSSFRGGRSAGVGHQPTSLFNHMQMVCNELASSRYITEGEIKDLRNSIDGLRSNRTRHYMENIYSARHQRTRINRHRAIDVELNMRQLQMDTDSNTNLATNDKKDLRNDLIVCLNSCGGIIDHKQQFEKMTKYFVEKYGTAEPVEVKQVADESHEY
ncbi:hypothetical protein M3Y98_00510800 [Aphelenchoides besseyi]|nr:hypothetical protein M3Y98_00510800 [Aphelenchoides besseyi]KAI6207851.1 hypothetical protein M3Y96_00052700 [Aphelenchoides besseyi]